VKGEHLMEYAPFIDDDGHNSTMLETSVLGLVWKLPSGGAHGETLTDAADSIVFNCTAAVGSVYWSSTALTLSPEPGVNVKSRPMLMYHGSHLSADALPTTSRKSTTPFSILLSSLLILTAHYY
jgi:hypothetical protein